MKPRLFKWSSYGWVCHGNGYSAICPHAMDAYKKWVLMTSHAVYKLDKGAGNERI